MVGISGQPTQDFEIPAPVDDVWAIYGTPELSKIIRTKIPNLFDKIEVDGDGGVGTFITLALPPGSPVGTYKEKLVTVDNVKRIKDADVVEGGYLNLGFTFFRTRFEVLEKGCNSSIVRVTIFYELSDQYQANASLVDVGGWGTVAKAVAEFLAEKAAAGRDC